MRKPTDADLVKAIDMAVWARLPATDTMTNRIVKVVKKLYEDEPTTPKWEDEFDKQIAVDTYGAKGFIREKLQELADDASEMTTKDLHKKWGLE